MQSDLIDDDRRFAKRLLACRTISGLSRQRLADAAKLSAATIKFLENGRMKPTVRTVFRLMTVPSLGLVIDDLPVALRETMQHFLSQRPATPPEYRVSCSSRGAPCSDTTARRALENVPPARA
jgi:transcriptional regulator with XRE-family HTH domain